MRPVAFLALFAVTGCLAGPPSTEEPLLERSWPEDAVGAALVWACGMKPDMHVLVVDGGRLHHVDLRHQWGDAATEGPSAGDVPVLSRLDAVAPDVLPQGWNDSARTVLVGDTARDLTRSEESRVEGLLRGADFPDAEPVYPERDVVDGCTFSNVGRVNSSYWTVQTGHTGVPQGLMAFRDGMRSLHPEA